MSTRYELITYQPLQRPAREWSRRDASDIDGQARGPNERDANESKLLEFNDSTNHAATAQDLRQNEMTTTSHCHERAMFFSTRGRAKPFELPNRGRNLIRTRIA